MTLTQNDVADKFLAAAYAVGLKNVMVMVGKVDPVSFVVTISIPNPTAGDSDAQLLVQSGAYEFDDAHHVGEIAADKARRFLEALPTIH